MTKNKIIGLVSGILVICGLIFFQFYDELLPYSMDKHKVVKEIHEKTDEETQNIKVQQMGKDDETSSEKQNLKEVAKEFPIDMKEAKVQEAIHKMTHQKVKAERKWGALQLIPERVNRLIEVVEANDYKYEEAYLSILNSWKQGDFSNIDLHHNTIWAFQGGTIGEAVGVLSPEEEQKFIEKHF